MMTESELLDILRTKNPEELTAQECDALRAAVGTMPELHRECAEWIRLEQYLAHGLGRANISVDTILSRAAAIKGGGMRTRLGWIVCAALVALVALVLSSSVIRSVGPIQKQPNLPPAAEVVHADSQPEVSPSPENSPPENISPVAAESALVATTPTEPPQPAVPSTPPAATPSEPDARQNDPWTIHVDALADAPASPRALFTMPAAIESTLAAEGLKRWFSPVAGRPSTFGVEPINAIACGKFEGVVQLRAPLAAGTSLRMAVKDLSLFRMHFWAGASGITLDSYGPAGPWAAYATTRLGTEPLPTGFRLVATDDGRMIRTYLKPKEPAIFELRHDDGLLTLSRGNVRIVEAPMAAPPTDIYFEGTCVLQGIAMTRAVPLPPNTWPHRDSPTHSFALQEQKWLQNTQPGGTFNELPGGGVELVAEKNPQPVWAAFALPDGGLHEIVFEIQSLAPGVGICLGDAEGKPLQLLRCVANQQNKSLMQLEPTPAPGNNQIEGPGLPHERPIAFVSEKSWLKVSQCGGILRCSVSDDGVHWAQAFGPIASPAFASIGLQAAAHPSRRTMVVRDIRVIRCEMLESLAPVDLKNAAVELPEVTAFPAWREAATNARPPAAHAEPWLRACALRRLASNCRKDLAIELLAFLWQDSLLMKMPLDDRLRLLNEIAMLAPVLTDPDAATRMARLYEDLGLILSDEGTPRCYSQVAHAQQTCPLMCNAPYLFFPESLARREVLELALGQRWDDLNELLVRLAFFGFADLPSNSPFFAWARAIAGNSLASSGAAPLEALTPRISLLPEWRHPLVAEPSKEGLNVSADFVAAIDGEDYSHLCEMLCAATADSALGLLPDRLDADLLTSLPVTVAAAMSELPKLQEVMRADFGERGSLRVRQAIDAADARGVEASTVEYFGTEAAAESHLWLGNRSLSAGDVVAAQNSYRLAQRTASPALKDRLLAAQRVADSLAGGEQMLAAAVQAPAALPAPRDYDPTVRGRLEADVGNNPGGMPPEYQRGGPGWGASSIDWGARQTAMLPLEGRLLISNRFQLASYHSQSGQLEWRAGLGGDAGLTHEWPGQAMRPIATSTHAYVRRLRKTGPTLAAILLAGGAIAWETKPRPGAFIVSDPILFQQAICACTATPVGDDYSIALATFDANSGQLLREQPLVSLRNGWWKQRDCQLSLIEGGYAITCGGSAISCDHAGNVRWVRRDLWVPAAVDSFWMFQAIQPPIIADGQLLVVQPGVPAVFALDAAHGRVAWKISMPGVRRALGIVSLPAEKTELLVVETTTGWVAIDVADGAMKWRVDSNDMLDACLVSQKEGVLVAVRERMEKEPLCQPVFLWLDSTTGTIRHRATFPTLKDPSPNLGLHLGTSLGPMVWHGERIWALSGRGPADPTRDLLEFVPR